jgi:hypothetical protein
MLGAGRIIIGRASAHRLFPDSRQASFDISNWQDNRNGGPGPALQAHVLHHFQTEAGQTDLLARRTQHPQLAQAQIGEDL